MRAYPQNPPVIQTTARGSMSTYQYTLLGPDMDELFAGAAKLQEDLKKVPGVIDVNSDLQIKNPQANIGIDRDKAAMYGVTPFAIETALYAAYGSSQISTIYSANNEYQVILEVQDDYQLTPEALSLLHVRSSHGQLVPLNAVVNVDTGVGPMSINHSGQQPSVTISFNLQPGVSLSDVTGRIEERAKADLTSTVTGAFQGTAALFQQTVKGMMWLFLAALLVIYLVLGILYESFYHPITILTAVIPACFGALAMLWIFNCELSVYAGFGILMLVGLVKKNGIMMIDFALDGQKAGKGAQDAIHEACLVRFRPIMMTTMAALMAGLPIAMGFGAGAESRRPLGLAVVGGLLVSQTVTLFVTPVAFVYMERLRVFVGHRLHGKPASEAGAVEAKAEEAAA
jgi:hydrophobic/amphiphilic exporter-1 (mainly G- bacteria), HAE1 family